ncbi:unnamed protein product [Malus baccata var. baccata]
MKSTTVRSTVFQFFPHYWSRSGFSSCQMGEASARIFEIKCGRRQECGAIGWWGCGGCSERNNGYFVACLSKSSAIVSSPLFAEALAVREGLALVSSRDFQNIIVESYSLQITQALRASFIHLSPLRLTVEY